MPKKKKSFIGYAKIARKASADSLKTKIEKFCKENNICKKLTSISFDIPTTSEDKKSLIPLLENLTEDDTLIICQTSDLSTNSKDIFNMLSSIREKKSSLYIMERSKEILIESGEIKEGIKELFIIQQDPVSSPEDIENKNKLLKKFLLHIYGDVKCSKPIKEKK